MWKKIKQNTTAIIGKIKSKGTEEDPKYHEAMEKYNELKKEAKEYLDNAQAFIDQISKLGRSFADMYKNLSVAIDTIPDEEAAEVNKGLNAFGEPLGTIEMTVSKVNEIIIGPIKAFQAILNEYQVQIKEHEKTKILLEQNKEKLANLQQKNKQPTEIQRYQEKVEDKTKRVTEMEEDFIEKMNNHWEQKTITFHKPISELNEILFEFRNQIQQASVGLQSNLGPEIMEREYKAEAPPPPKK